MGASGLKKTGKSTDHLEPARAHHPSADHALADLPLRDRKKATQRTKLVRIAYELFRRDGFDQVRLEDIAAQADVSVPTLYNYFNNKRDLLIEILIQDRKDGAAAYEKVIRNPSANPSDAMAELIYANVDIIRSVPDKRLWREIFGAVALCHDRERDAFDRNHQSFKTYIKRLLQHFVGTGALPADYPLDIAADLIFALNAHNLRRLAASQSCTPEDIRDITRKQMQLLLRQDDGDFVRQPASRSRRLTPPKKKIAAASKTARSKGQAHVQNKT